MNKTIGSLKTKSETIVVTSGSAYIDIDVLACSLALNHLHSLIGLNSISCHTGKMNGTIPESYQRRVNKLYIDNLPSDGNFSYILVDVSDPSFFESFVDVNKIIEIYDHHFGFEELWKKNLGSNSTIHHVGSCATLIWEKYCSLNLEGEIPPLLAELLYLAIVSNTLNFKAFITTERDKKAKAEIENSGLVKGSSVDDYYSSVECEIIRNFKNSLLNDVKKHACDGNSLFIGQLELLDSSKVLDNFFSTGQVKKYMEQRFIVQGELWFVIVSDISKECNFLYTTCGKTKSLIENKLQLYFKEDFAITDRLWMRKEIIRDMK